MSVLLVHSYTQQETQENIKQFWIIMLHTKQTYPLSYVSYGLLKFYSSHRLNLLNTINETEWLHKHYEVYCVNTQ